MAGGGEDFDHMQRTCVTPYELFGGTDGIGSRSNPSEYILATKDFEYGRAVMHFS